jgi:hypothetical protein
VAPAGLRQVSATPEQPVVLPFVPEPVLSPEERAELSKLFADPAFWEWFESQPEPDV